MRVFRDLTWTISCLKRRTKLDTVILKRLLIGKTQVARIVAPLLYLRSTVKSHGVLLNCDVEKAYTTQYGQCAHSP